MDRLALFKKDISSTCFPYPPSPSRAPGVSGSRPFFTKRKPAPQFQPVADDGTRLHVQRHATAAGGESPLVHELSSAVLMPGTEPESCPGIPIYHVSVALQCRKAPGKPFFPAEPAFSFTCTGLLYKFRRRIPFPIRREGQSRMVSLFRKLELDKSGFPCYSN